MTLEEKMKLNDKCKEGMFYAAAGCLFVISESTLQCIKKYEDMVRETMNGSASVQLSMCSTSRTK